MVELHEPATRASMESANLVSGCDQDRRDGHREDDPPMSFAVSMSRKETSET
jgi:hypothetical protein